MFNSQNLLLKVQDLYTEDFLTTDFFRDPIKPLKRNTCCARNHIGSALPNTAHPLQILG